jgi:hypothetical protein
MPKKWQVATEFLEEGNIYFFYKPKRGIAEVTGINDISRFYFVLDPYESKQIRFIVMGPKKLPSVANGKERAWGLVEKVGGRGFITTEKQTESEQKRSARAAGEGIYAIVRHIDHTHLVYSLELPVRLGEVQKALGIARQASYIFIIKHPDAPTPASQQPVPQSKVSDENFLHQFGTRRYIPVDPPNLLDYQGATILAIGVSDELRPLGIQANKDKETEDTADIFNKLRMDRKRHATEPLIKGKWK